MYEYEARMYAYNLQQVDKHHDMHLQAWLNHHVTATKGKGDKQTPAYKSFNEFFDYEKELKKVNQIDDKKDITEHQRSLAQLASNLNKG